MSLQAFFDSFEDGCGPRGTASFQWAAKGIGFGGMYFYFDPKDGYVHCDNEAMGREFIKRMLGQMVDNCVLDCPGDFEETGGKPPGYTPRPVDETKESADNQWIEP